MYQYTDGLVSERLTTRFLTKDDVPAWEEFFTYPEAVELIPEPFFIPGANNAGPWIERQMKRYADQKYGMQALIEKATGSFIGMCGLMLQEVDGMQELEVGYHLIKRFWGKGYAPEAARLFINYVFNNNISPYVISIIDTRNARSAKVAEKNGLRISKTSSWNNMATNIYRIDKP